MKKILLSLTVAFFAATYLFAQPTNMDMESWAGIEPNGWATMNVLVSYGGPQSTFQETANPGEGLSSAKIATVDCPFCALYGFPDTLTGLLALGTINQTTLSVDGVPYTSKPVSLSFVYKSNPMPGDANAVVVELHHWNGSSSDVVGQGVFTEPNVVANWTVATIPITYVASDTPDTLLIVAVASGASIGIPGSVNIKGSELYVDSFALYDPCAGFSVTTTATDETGPTANDGSVSTTITGGTPAFSYSWSNGQTGATATGLDGGDYTVTVTDANSCIAIDSATVNTTGCAGFSATASATDENGPNGNDGTATATASGGTAPYTYAWSNGQIGQTATALDAGTYSVTITDNIGCTTTASATVNTGGCTGFSATATATNTGGTGMNNGSATATTTAGTSPFTYAWSNGQTGATATGLAAGTYSVTITDNIGCTATASCTVANPPAGINLLSNTNIVSLYPNPNKGVFNVQLNKSANEQMDIYNILGEQVYSTRLTTNNEQLTTNLPEGMYFFQLKNNVSETIKSGKFSIVK